eukprot:4913673-Pleurochrysis_carterae.AAC.1
MRRENTGRGGRRAPCRMTFSSRSSRISMELARCAGRAPSRGSGGRRVLASAFSHARGCESAPTSECSSTRVSARARGSARESVSACRQSYATALARESACVRECGGWTGNVAVPVVRGWAAIQSLGPGGRGSAACGDCAQRTGGGRGAGRGGESGSGSGEAARDRTSVDEAEAKGNGRRRRCGTARGSGWTT